jgi:hypothetical protein
MRVDPNFLCVLCVSASKVNWWGGSPWPPVVRAGTEARPTKLFMFYGWVIGP